MNNIPKPLPQGQIHLSPMHYSSSQPELFTSPSIDLITMPYPFYYSDSYFTPSYNSYYLRGNLVFYPRIGNSSDNMNYGTAGGESRKFSPGRGYGPGERSGGFSGNFGGGFGGLGMNGIKFGQNKN